MAPPDLLISVVSVASRCGAPHAGTLVGAVGTNGAVIEVPGEGVLGAQ